MGCSWRKYNNNIFSSVCMELVKSMSTEKYYGKTFWCFSYEIHYTVCNMFCFCKNILGTGLVWGNALSALQCPSLDSLLTPGLDHGVTVSPLTPSTKSSCEVSSEALTLWLLRGSFSMPNLICHATFTLHVSSNNQIIFCWIRSVVTACKISAVWWESNTSKGGVLRCVIM